MSESHRSSLGVHPRATPSVALFSGDPHLVEAVQRLAAAVDVEVVVHESIADSRSAYASSATVLLGADVLDDVLAVAVPRRSHVVILAASPEPTVWRQAVDIGAEQVLDPGAAERDLIELLIDAGTSQAHESPLVCITSGCGGAGASSLAAAISVTAAQRGTNGGVLLLDGDPIGGGLDILLEAESMQGLRWGDLAATQGRVSPTSLRNALPCVEGVHLLSHGRRAVEVPAGAWDAVSAAGTRGFSLTVVDGAPDPVRARATSVIMVVPLDLRALAAASARLPELQQQCRDVRLVLRRRRDSALDADDAASVLTAPIIGEFADARPVMRERVVESILVGLDLHPHGRRARGRAA